MGLTAVILTNKNPKYIKRTISSVNFADEIIIIRDQPAKSPVKSKKETILSRPLKHDFAAQRNFGLSKSINDWVLFVDDDEIVTKELAKEIKNAISQNNFSGYCIKRSDRYQNKVIHYGETGNTKLLRLAKKSAGLFFRSVHETWKINGEISTLNNALIHERGDLVSPFIDRIAFYGPLDAKELKKENKPFSYRRLILNPVGKFLSNYFMKLGFLDGLLGLFHAYLMSVQSLSVRVFQWQKSLV